MQIPSRTVSRWELFPHGSDVGVRGIGSTREEAFEQAATALTGVVTDPGRVEERQRIEITCLMPDDELLLYEWLNALVARMSIEHMLFSRFRVRFRDGGLEAEAWGEPIDVRRHQPAVEIKGATVTELAVRHRDDGLWVAQCIVDV